MGTPYYNPLSHASLNLQFCKASLDFSLPHIHSHTKNVLLKEWREFLIEIMHFDYMTNRAMLLHKSPCPVGHEIYNVVKFSLLLVTIYQFSIYLLYAQK